MTYAATDFAESILVIMVPDSNAPHAATRSSGLGPHVHASLNAAKHAGVVKLPMLAQVHAPAWGPGDDRVVQELGGDGEGPTICAGVGEETARSGQPEEGRPRRLALVEGRSAPPWVSLTVVGGKGDARGTRGFAVLLVDDRGGLLPLLLLLLLLLLLGLGDAAQAPAASKAPAAATSSSALGCCRCIIGWAVLLTDRLCRLLADVST